MNPSTSVRKPAVLITGASRGLGAALAAEFANAGHDLILVARSADKLRELADQLITGRSITVDVLPCDLTESGASQRILDFCGTRGRQPGILINNAGLMNVIRLEHETIAGLAGMIDLNVRAASELTLLALPGMLSRRSGTIINISSMAGMQALPECVVYSATKAYLTAFSDALRREIWGSGVECITVLLGPLRTEMLSGGPNGVTQLHVLNGLAADPKTAAAVIYESVLARRHRFSTGWLGTAILFGLSVLPRRISAALAGRVG